MNDFTCTFDPDTPDDCPPKEAAQATQTIYRCVPKKTVGPEDFYSDVKAKRRFFDSKKCQCWGCSVWKDEAAVDHAISLIPSFKKQYIAVGSIDANDGAVLHTKTRPQPQHHTFWQAHNIDVSHKFSIFMEKGVKV